MKFTILKTMPELSSLFRSSCDSKVSFHALKMPSCIIKTKYSKHSLIMSFFNGFGFYFSLFFFSLNYFFFKIVVLCLIIDQRLELRGNQRGLVLHVQAIKHFRWHSLKPLISDPYHCHVFPIFFPIKYSLKCTSLSNYVQVSKACNLSSS